MVGRLQKGSRRILADSGWLDGETVEVAVTVAHVWRCRWVVVWRWFNVPTTIRRWWCAVDAEMQHTGSSIQWAASHRRLHTLECRLRQTEGVSSRTSSKTTDGQARGA